MGGVRDCIIVVLWASFPACVSDVSGAGAHVGTIREVNPKVEGSIEKDPINTWAPLMEKAVAAIERRPPPPEDGDEDFSVDDAPKHYTAWKKALERMVDHVGGVIVEKRPMLENTASKLTSFKVDMMEQITMGCEAMIKGGSDGNPWHQGYDPGASDESKSDILQHFQKTLGTMDTDMLEQTLVQCVEACLRNHWAMPLPDVCLCMSLAGLRLTFAQR